MDKAAVVAIIIMVIITAFAFIQENPSILLFSNGYNVTDIHDCVLRNFDLGNECDLGMNRTERILLIGISGMGYDTYADYPVYTLSRISERGAVYRAQTVAAESDVLTFPAILSGDDGKQVPALLEDEGYTAVTVSSEKFIRSVYLEGNALSSDMDWNRNGIIGDNYDIGVGASKVIRGMEPDFMFVAFNLDSTLHRYGPVSEHTASEMERINDGIQEIFNELDGRWTVIVVGDHGFSGCRKMTVGGLKYGCHGENTRDSIVPILIVQSKNLFN